MEIYTKGLIGSFEGGTRGEGGFGMVWSGWGRQPTSWFGSLLKSWMVSYFPLIGCYNVIHGGVGLKGEISNIIFVMLNLLKNRQTKKVKKANEKL